MNNLRTIRNLSIAFLLSATLFVASIQPVMASSNNDSGDGGDKTTEPGDKNSDDDKNKGDNEDTEKKQVKVLTYDECVTKLNKASDPTKIVKVTQKLSDKAIAGINKAKEQVSQLSDDKLSADQKSKLTSQLDASLTKVNELSSQAKDSEDTETLVKNYCEIYSSAVFGIAQASDVIILAKLSNVDARINQVLNHKANQNIKNPLKVDAEARLTEAKESVAKNDPILKEISIDSVLNAKDYQALTTLFPEEKKTELIANAKRAVRLHTESWAIRAMGRQINPTLKGTIVGEVQMLGKSGEPIPEDSAGRPAKKAIAEIKIGNATYKKEVIRDDKISRWRYSNPNNSEDTETVEEEGKNMKNDNNDDGSKNEGDNSNKDTGGGSSTE